MEGDSDLENGMHLAVELTGDCPKCKSEYEMRREEKMWKKHLTGLKKDSRV